MRVAEALSYLGSKRVIWIDDCFSDTPGQDRAIACDKFGDRQSLQF